MARKLTVKVTINKSNNQLNISLPRKKLSYKVLEGIIKDQKLSFTITEDKKIGNRKKK